MTESDFHVLGAWKDGALRKSDLERSGFDPGDVRFNGKWSPEAASTAYETWMRAAKELSGRMTSGYPSDVAAFLTDWSKREAKSGTKAKRFGLSRATTLLHFVSGGRYPIFDSRVRRAVKKLTRVTQVNSVDWYVNEFCQISRELAELCETVSDCRKLDKALFAYGGRD
jgi:hypothetical protein